MKNNNYAQALMDVLLELDEMKEIILKNNLHKDSEMVNIVSKSMIGVLDQVKLRVEMLAEIKLKPMK